MSPTNASSPSLPLYASTYRKINLHEEKLPSTHARSCLLPSTMIPISVHRFQNWRYRTCASISSLVSLSPLPSLFSILPENSSQRNSVPWTLVLDSDEGDHPSPCPCAKRFSFMRWIHSGKKESDPLTTRAEFRMWVYTVRRVLRAVLSNRWASIKFLLHAYSSSSTLFRRHRHSTHLCRCLRRGMNGFYRHVRVLFSFSDDLVFNIWFVSHAHSNPMVELDRQFYQ